MKYTTIMITVLIALMLAVTACSSGETTTTEDSTIETETITEDGEVATDTADEDMSKTASVKELMNMGKSLHCSFETSIGGQSTEQDIYLDGEKFRMNMKSTINGETQSAYMINDGEWFYSWDSTKQGMKMTINLLEQDGNDMTASLQEAYDYNCKPWVASKDKFEAPSDVEFVDFGEMMLGMEDSMGNIPME